MDNQNKNPILPLITAVIVATLVIFGICTYQLRVTDVAIVTTFGKSQVTDTPGLHFRFPWPVQKVHRYDRRNQLLVGAIKETVTRDNINIITQHFTTWNLSDPLMFFSRVGNFGEAESILKSLIESKKESVFRNYNLSDFISTDPVGLKLDAIETELLRNVKKQAADSYGIAIHTIGLSQISLHESNTESVLNRMKQEQSKIAAEIRSEGEKEAKIIRDNASSRKAQELAKAEAEAKKIRGDAVIKAAEQYDKFQEDLDFAIFLRKLDALEETMKTKTTIILDPKTAPYDLLKFEQ